MSNQPADISDGLRQAYEALSRGLQQATHGIIVVPSQEYERMGTGAAVKSVVKAVPGAILKPMIGATEAISRALMGVKNTVNPLKKKEADDKYKKRERTRK